MNEGLASLIGLQEADLKLAELKRRIADVPAQLSALDAQLATHDALVARSKEKLDEVQKERRRLEGEVELQRGKLSKYKDQLMAVKKNEEYQAVIKEIETCNREITRAEDRILDFMEFIENLEKDLKSQEAEFRRGRDEVRRQREQLESYVAGLEDDCSRLSRARDGLESQVPRELLEIYKRIASQRRGVGLAEARDLKCQACYVILRPQVVNDLRHNVQIIQCESCARILYWKENATAQVP